MHTAATKHLAEADVASRQRPQPTIQGCAGAHTRKPNASVAASTAPIVYSLTDHFGDVSVDPCADRATPDVGLLARMACHTSGGAIAAKSNFPASETALSRQTDSSYYAPMMYVTGTESSSTLRIVLVVLMVVVRINIRIVTAAERASRTTLNVALAIDLQRLWPYSGRVHSVCPGLRCRSGARMGCV